MEQTTNKKKGEDLFDTILKSSGDKIRKAIDELFSAKNELKFIRNAFKDEDFDKDDYTTWTEQYRQIDQLTEDVQDAIDTCYQVFEDARHFENEEGGN